MDRHKLLPVATVLTACGIETHHQNNNEVLGIPIRLQRRLPLAVLKQPFATILTAVVIVVLQQCLPLAVLKLLL